MPDHHHQKHLTVEMMRLCTGERMETEAIRRARARRARHKHRNHYVEPRGVRECELTLSFVSIL